jgi:hypothetical protein
VRLTKQEQETIIVFNQADDTASVYTCSKSWMQHIEKTLGLKPTALHGHAREYEVPKAWIRKPRKPRQLSESQKQKLRQRLSQRSILRRETPTAVGETRDGDVE